MEKSKSLIQFYAAEEDDGAAQPYDTLPVVVSLGLHASVHFDICVTSVSAASGGVTYTSTTAVLDYVQTRMRMEKALPGCTPSCILYQLDEMFRLVAGKRLHTRTLRLQQLKDSSFVARHAGTAALCGVDVLPFAVSMMLTNMLYFPEVFEIPAEYSLHPLHTVFLEVLRIE
jgi:hypothetical protein